eukprot:747965-Hanusia_phi.AAC.2
MAKGFPPSHVGSNLPLQCVLSLVLSVLTCEFLRQNLRRASRVPVGVGCYFQIVSKLELLTGCQGGTIKVKEIAHDSPAFECQKIRIGDQLLRVDSVDVQGKSLSQLSGHVLGECWRGQDDGLRVRQDKPAHGYSSSLSA